MAGKGQGGDGGSQIEMVWLIMAVLAILGAWALWTYAKGVIVIPALAIDYVLIRAIEHTRGLGETGNVAKDFAASFFDGRRDPWNGNDITWEQFAYLRSVVGSQVNLIICGAIAALAFFIKLKMRGDGFRRVFSLAGGKGKGPSFARFQSDFWRVATYSALFDPDGRDSDILPAATPLEWLRDNDVTYENGAMDAEACKRAFAEQLGKQWHSFDRATLHARAVLLICALHLTKAVATFPGHGKRNVSLHEREVLSIAFAGGKDGTKAMKAFVEKYSGDAKLRGIIDKVGKKHAYENTVIYALLDVARARAGVLKEHDMAYIKRIDRNMWYGLNNCGRKRFHTEGAGIISHFFSERIVGRSLVEPHVDQACEGVENYLREEGIDSLTEFFAPEDDLLS